MATKNVDRSPRRKFKFTYKGGHTAVVEVVVDTFEKAQRGRANAQQSILLRYKRQAGINKAATLLWKHLVVEPVAERDTTKSTSS
jgi:hypothetical protein